MYYVYILQGQKDDNFYTGFTSDLKRRLREHREGSTLSTKDRRPVRLIYYEAYLLEEDARARERYLKTSMGKRVIKNSSAIILRSKVL